MLKNFLFVCSYIYAFQFIYFYLLLCIFFWIYLLRSSPYISCLSFKNIVSWFNYLCCHLSLLTTVDNLYSQKNSHITACAFFPDYAVRNALCIMDPNTDFYPIPLVVSLFLGNSPFILSTRVTYIHYLHSANSGELPFYLRYTKWFFKVPETEVCFTIFIYGLPSHFIPQGLKQILKLAF